MNGRKGPETYDRSRGKHEIYDRLLTGSQVDFQEPAVRDWLHTAALPTATVKN